MTDVQWERAAVALVHPMRVAILRMLSVEPVLSPKQMADRLKLPLGRVSYHVRLMHDRELIKLASVEPRRGALEHYYALSNHRLPSNGKQADADHS